MIKFMRMIWYLILLAAKIAIYSVLAVTVCAIVLTLIPIEFRLKVQNNDDESDSVFFRVSWLFSGLVFVASADISGAYEYRLSVLGRNIIRKRDIFYDEEDL